MGASRLTTGPHRNRKQSQSEYRSDLHGLCSDTYATFISPLPRVVPIETHWNHSIDRGPPSFLNGTSCTARVRRSSPSRSPGRRIGDKLHFLLFSSPTSELVSDLARASRVSYTIDHCMTEGSAGVAATNQGTLAAADSSAAASDKGRGGRSFSRGGGRSRHSSRGRGQGRDRQRRNHSKPTDGDKQNGTQEKSTNDVAKRTEDAISTKEASIEAKQPNGEQRGGHRGGRGRGSGRAVGGKGRGKGRGSRKTNDSIAAGDGIEQKNQAEDSEIQMETSDENKTESKSAAARNLTKENVVTDTLVLPKLQQEPDVLTSLLTGVPPTFPNKTKNTIEPESEPSGSVESTTVPSTKVIKIGGKKGVPVILSRQHAQDHNEETSDIQPVKKPKKKSKRKTKSKAAKSEGLDSESVKDEQKDEPVSTVTAIEKLPGVAVSITASTQITIRRTESQTSLDSSKYATGDYTNNAFTNSAAAVGKKGGKVSSSKRKKSKGGRLGNEDAVNQQLVRRFNQRIRLAVDQSDLPGIRELLQDKRNHHFALDPNVLETVQKAFMTAALFDDALYCLRNCTMPGTMTLSQTERILLCLPQNLRNSSSYTAADLMNALCIATNFDSPKKRTYLLRIIRGIALEFLEEATSARDRICSAPCERLVRAGLCIVDARLKRGKKPADLIVVPGNQLCFVPENLEQRGIAPGDAVSILPYAGPYPMSAESLDRNMIEATVTNINPVVLRLQDKLNTNLYASLTEPIEGNVYRIDKLANRMGFNRQLAAAVAICSPIDETARDFRRPCPQLIEAITSMDENIIRFNGALPRGEMTTTASLCSDAIPWNVEDEGDSFDTAAARESNRLALEKYGLLDGLNPSQCLALEGATINRLSLVQGPPGTGMCAYSDSLRLMAIAKLT